MDTYHGWSLTTPLSSATTARSLFTKARRREILRTSRFCALRPNGVLRSSRRCKNVPAPGHSRIAEEVRVLRGGLALDALYLLARDVDRAGELVGPEHPAVDHILDLPRSEVQILGRLPQGDFLAGFVFHPTNLLARQRWVRAPTRIHRTFLLPLFTGVRGREILRTSAV